MHSAISVTFILLGFFSSILMWFSSSRLKPITLVFCNILFFILLKASWVDYLYILFLTLYTTVAGSLLTRKKKRAFAYSLIYFPIIGLCFFKYAGYLSFLDNLWMPIGISFYTFKSIRYLFDIDAKKIKKRSILYVFDYLFYFPAFFAGPIHKADSFFAELKKEFHFNYLTQKDGFIQMALGVFMKMVVADELSSLSTICLKNDNGWFTLLGVILYSFYIYIDFDAYSNVAIGISTLMGIPLERNFNVPYLSKNLKEFWQRWHISLSTWLKEYVYFPLGGSRKGTVRKRINTIVVFLVSGLWHGSTFLFLLWGLGHGVFRVLEDVWDTYAKKLSIPSFLKKPLSVLSIFKNFIVVSFLWIFFRSSSLAEVGSILTRILSIFVTPMSSIQPSVIGITGNEWTWMFILLFIVIASDLFRYKQNGIIWLHERPLLFRWCVYTCLIALTIIFGVYGSGYTPQNFIYATF